MAGPLTVSRQDTLVGHAKATRILALRNNVRYSIMILKYLSLHALDSQTRAEMSKKRKLIRFSNLCGFVTVFLLFQNFGLYCSLNEEGNVLLKLRQRIVSDPFGALSNWIDDEVSLDPCNWFGVECSDGRVVVLNLKDLCLGGTLAPEIVNLVHIKSIVLWNNSFSLTISERFVDLKDLEVLDLGYNNFSGHLPADFGSNISLGILLLDNNEFLVSLSPEINELKTLSEFQVNENQLANAAKFPACAERLFTWHNGPSKGARGLQEKRKLVIKSLNWPKLPCCPREFC
ncbi:hypothetical protein VNO77_22701 [Canavalia gladiata]|uniref:Leucine-rich repeat-containing N-terminal plant-type domain-containing protein n=1 Tax=Canavalia gladiata TaxID=3824 RepID=A0AAN9L3K0_CANGL